MIAIDSLARSRSLWGLASVGCQRAHRHGSAPAYGLASPKAQTSLRRWRSHPFLRGVKRAPARAAIFLLFSRHVCASSSAGCHSHSHTRKHASAAHTAVNENSPYCERTKKTINYQREGSAATGEERERERERGREREERGACVRGVVGECWREKAAVVRSSRPCLTAATGTYGCACHLRA